MLCAFAVLFFFVANAQAASVEVPPQSGEKLVHCVTFKWTAPGDTPRLQVEVWVFGKGVARRELNLTDTRLEFSFEDGFVKANGALDATFDRNEGSGTLLLDTLDYSCDFSGEYSISNRKVTDFRFLPRFDY